MPVQARINRFRTRPYESQELAEMQTHEYERVKALRSEKVLAEELIEDIAANDLSHLQQRLLEICEACNPNPIIVTTPENNEDPAVKHSFLIGKEYSINSDTPKETILYSPKKSELYVQRRTERERLEVRPEPPSQAQIAALRNQSIPFFFNQSLKAIGFANLEEFNAFLKDLHAKRVNFENEEQFLNFCRKEGVETFQKRIVELRASRMVSRARETAANLSSILSDEMTVHCRIIGKSGVLVSMYRQYYLKWHNISDPVFWVDNVEDELTTSFVYGKDPFGGH